jgi:hypothetical protein
MTLATHMSAFGAPVVVHQKHDRVVGFFFYWLVSVGDADSSRLHEEIILNCAHL